MLFFLNKVDFIQTYSFNRSKNLRFTTSQLWMIWTLGLII